MKKLFHYFTKTEIAIWVLSLTMLTVSFSLFDSTSVFRYICSIIGVTSLIFCSKGNFIGLILVIIFSLLYAIISYFAGYYGESITYAGMTLPMSVYSLIVWLKHPHKGKSTEVEIRSLSKKDVVILVPLAIITTVIFYFILKAFNTENLIISTISVTTSFAAVYLTQKRSPYFALAYAFNDIVLISLWILATMQDISYQNLVICFASFLINDIYTFINWNTLKKRQTKT